MSVQDTVRKGLRSGAPSFLPAVVGFNVDPGGGIGAGPTRFIVGKNEFVTWFIGNQSNEPISVTLSQFSRKRQPSDDKGDPLDPAMPLIWIGSNSVSLQPNTSGFITALRDPNYSLKDPIFHDFFSYTIGIKGTTIDIAWDPDGEIKP